MFDKKITLNNGVQIPMLGLGTWLMSKEEAYLSCLAAIEAGYRHIDTAVAYRNEEAVGRAVRDCGLPREQIFVTTKVPAEAKNEKAARKEIEGSFERLGLDYIDLVIIHCPQPWIFFRKFERRYDKGNVAVYKVLEEYYKAGKIKAIGVSNFLQKDLENILDNCEVVPAINQILAHVKNNDLDTINFCDKKGIVVEAYSPLGHGSNNVLKDKDIVEMAKKYNVTPAQLCLKYCLQLNMVILPKSTNIEHIKANGELDFEISVDDMEKLIKLDKIKDYGKDDWYPVFSKGK